MKKKHISRVCKILLVTILTIGSSINVCAKTYNNTSKISQIKINDVNIQRVYNGGNLVFTYTHDITYHFDSVHSYTDRVENGTNASQFGNNLAASKGINISSYTPYGASGSWKLLGWKLNDGSANANDVNNNIISQNNCDLYAVWVKDCTSYFNFNGGSCTAWNSFGTDWYARGSAYYNNGNITPFSIKLPTVSRANYTLTSITNNGVGSYAQGGTYNLTDKAIFTCNWKQNCASGTISTSWQAYENNIYHYGVTQERVAAGSTVTITFKVTPTNEMGYIAYGNNLGAGIKVHENPNAHFSIAAGQYAWSNWNYNNTGADWLAAYNAWDYYSYGQYPMVTSWTVTYVAPRDLNGLSLVLNTGTQGHTGQTYITGWGVVVTITPP